MDDDLTMTDATLLPLTLVTSERWSEFVEWAHDAGYDESYHNRWDSKSIALQLQFIEETSA